MAVELTAHPRIDTLSAAETSSALATIVATQEALRPVSFLIYDMYRDELAVGVVIKFVNDVQTTVTSSVLEGTLGDIRISVPPVTSLQDRICEILTESDAETIDVNPDRLSPTTASASYRPTIIPDIYLRESTSTREPDIKHFELVGKRHAEREIGISVIDIEIPVIDDSNSEPVTYAVLPEEAPVDGKITTRRRVLTVDPDDDWREDYIRWGTEAGHEVVGVPTISEAVKLLREGGFDLVITSKHDGNWPKVLAEAESIGARTVIVSGEAVPTIRGGYALEGAQKRNITFISKGGDARTELLQLFDSLGNEDTQDQLPEDDSTVEENRDNNSPTETS